MSLTSVARSAARATRNTNPAFGTIARKGDLVVLESVHSSTRMHGDTTNWVSYDVAVVTRATRDGEVTATTRGPCPQNTRLHLVSRDLLPGRDAKRVLDRLPFPASYTTLDDARHAVRRAILDLQQES